jgi:hypothetical protein
MYKTTFFLALAALAVATPDRPAWKREANPEAAPAASPNNGPAARVTYAPYVGGNYIRPGSSGRQGNQFAYGRNGWKRNAEAEAEADFAEESEK